MKAMLFKSKLEPLVVSEVENPVPQREEMLIKLEYAALNHLEIWITQEQVMEKPVILGADGSGTVVAVGEGLSREWIGKEVIVNPALYWGDNESIQSDKFEILGNRTNGTFAGYISVHRDYVYAKPKHLSLKEAAALPLAALTAYRALFTKAKLSANEKILVTGIGGGAALYLLQIAKAAGADVYVSSSSQEKIDKAIVLGATKGFNYRNENWLDDVKKSVGGFDVIVDSAGGNGFSQLTEIANPGARLVLFGRTAGNINNLQPRMIFNKQLVIMGTIMGSQKEFGQMISFFEEHRIHPVLDKEFPLSGIADAFEYMSKGKHFGKILINTNK
jgi:NADPH:quinone reductase-like Zn-dependent oxidoreductase